MILPNVAELKLRLKALLGKLTKLIIDNPLMICAKTALKKAPHARL
jgi:hypothetical protein